MDSNEKCIKKGHFSKKNEVRGESEEVVDALNQKVSRWK